MKFDKFGSGKINVIFLHGWGANKNSFLWIKEYLTTATLHFATLDGFDGTPAPIDPTIKGYCDRLKDYIKSNKLRNIVLVGHSFGGRIAIEFAQTNNVLALVLVDSAGIKPKFSLTRQLKIVKFKLAKALAKRGLISEKKLEKYGSSDYKNCLPQMKKVFMSAINYNQKDMLKNIVCQTLIVWGKEDRETPPYMARLMNKKIRNSSLVFLDGGHFCFLDNKFEFYSLLQDFSNKIKGDKNE